MDGLRYTDIARKTFTMEYFKQNKLIDRIDKSDEIFFLIALVLKGKFT